MTAEGKIGQPRLHGYEFKAILSSQCDECVYMSMSMSMLMVHYREGGTRRNVHTRIKRKEVSERGIFR